MAGLEFRLMESLMELSSNALSHDLDKSSSSPPLTWAWLCKTNTADCIRSEIWSFLSNIKVYNRCIKNKDTDISSKSGCFLKAGALRTIQLAARGRDLILHALLKIHCRHLNQAIRCVKWKSQRGDIFKLDSRGYFWSMGGGGHSGGCRGINSPYRVRSVDSLIV